MKPRDEEKTTDDAEADVGPYQSSEDYVCVDPEQGIVVFDWLNGFNNEAKEMVALHLRLCLHCREAVADWRSLHQPVEVAQANYAHSAAACIAAAKGSITPKGTKTGGAKSPRLKAKGNYGGK